MVLIHFFSDSTIKKLINIMNRLAQIPAVKWKQSERTLAEFFNLHRRKEKISGIYGIFSQLRPMVRYTIKYDSSCVVYNFTHFWILGSIHQHLFD